MEPEERIEILIKELNLEQKRNFCVFCIERIIGLYKNIDLFEDISLADASILKGKAYDALVSIFDFAKNDINSKTKDQIKDQIEKCDPLILDIENIFDNSTRNYIAATVAQSVDYLLEYCLNGDDKFVFYCSSNNIEILNQLKSDYYYANVNPESTSEELYLEAIFKQEYSTQIKIIEYIKSNDRERIDSIILKNKII